MVAQEESRRSVEDIDVKLLADMSWTRANVLERTEPSVAKEWILAALMGYEFLVRHASPAIAESAQENVEMLRSYGQPAASVRQG
jgi:hypothetical protein